MSRSMSIASSDFERSEDSGTSSCQSRQSFQSQSPILVERIRHRSAHLPLQPRSSYQPVQSYSHLASRMRAAADRVQDIREELSSFDRRLSNLNYVLESARQNVDKTMRSSRETPRTLSVQGSARQLQFRDLSLGQQRDSSSLRSSFSSTGWSDSST